LELAEWEALCCARHIATSGVKVNDEEKRLESVFVIQLSLLFYVYVFVIRYRLLDIPKRDTTCFAFRFTTKSTFAFRFTIKSFFKLPKNVPIHDRIQLYLSITLRFTIEIQFGVFCAH